jgi:hypothetical protein
MIPSLLLSASAGAIVDRVDYFRLLRLTQLFTLCYAVAVAALSFAGLIGIGLFFPHAGARRHAVMRRTAVSSSTKRHEFSLQIVTGVTRWRRLSQDKA